MEFARRRITVVQCYPCLKNTDWTVSRSLALPAPPQYLQFKSLHLVVALSILLGRIYIPIEADKMVFVALEVGLLAGVLYVSITFTA